MPGLDNSPLLLKMLRSATLSPRAVYAPWRLSAAAAVRKRVVAVGATGTFDTINGRVGAGIPMRHLSALDAAEFSVV